MTPPRRPTAPVRGLLRLAGPWLLAASLVTGCDSHRASAGECRAILDRIVELELRELGFRDAALLGRKRDEARRTLEPELRRCAGVRVRSGALECVRAAASTEEISHRCLR